MSLFTIAVLLAVPLAAAGQHVAADVCPLHPAHMKAKPTADQAHAGHAEMEARGAVAMGFDQSRASHHFVLLPDGGRIEIHVNDPADDVTRQQVTGHLELISRQFKSGDFGIPAATHGETPPGAADMTRLRSHIDYAFERSAHGGAVTIRTSDAKALEAVHAFLRYQIREHRTGTPEQPKR